MGVSEVGKRLKSVRLEKGLSLRKFAKSVGEDSSVMFHIETGERYPPKLRLEKFAKVLSLTPKQLEAMIAVERRGLNPYVLLPEIPPAQIAHIWIENEAEKVINKFCRGVSRAEIELPVPIDSVVRDVCRLSLKYCDFADEDIASRSNAALFGGLYPDGFRGKDRLIIVNNGRVRGKHLSEGEKRITVAHEAGHYVLHCGNKESAQLFFRFTKEPTFCREAECEQTPFNALEYQASVFAACLLMPQKQFRREWQNVSGSVSALVKTFVVTQSFVHFRAKMLNCG